VQVDDPLGARSKMRCFGRHRIAAAGICRTAQALLQRQGPQAPGCLLEKITSRAKGQPLVSRMHHGELPFLQWIV